MEGYTQNEYVEFREIDDDEDDEADWSEPKKIKYTVLKEEDFITETTNEIAS